MIFTLIYILACIFSDNISFHISYLIGALLLDLLIGYPTITIIFKRRRRNQWNAINQIIIIH